MFEKSATIARNKNYNRILQVFVKMDTHKICVIGAGVSGLASSVLIQTKLKEAGVTAQVTLISAKLSPETTSDGAGGFWGPHLVSSDQLDKIKYDLRYILWKCILLGMIHVSSRNTRLGNLVTIQVKTVVSSLCFTNNFSINNELFWRDLV